MERCDVVIVGGGPAGSSCAWQLARRGLDVVVLDRAKFPRDKTCAGWVTPQVIESLELSLSDYASKRVLQPIRGFRVGMRGAPGCSVDHGSVVSYGILRREFDEYLLRRSGARLCLGKRLESLSRDGDGWLIDGTLQARVLIGAGGHFCPVARELSGEAAQSERAVTAREIELELEPHELERYEANVPELFFERDLTGYGWLVRKGSWLNVGLGCQADDLNARLRTFLDDLRELGRLPDRPLPTLHGHAYLLRGQTPRRPSREGALLIGDALGLADTYSGEGIRAAVESGLLAAEVLCESKADPSAGALAEYDARMRARFGANVFDAVPPAPHDGRALSRLRSRIGGWLLGRRAFARHVVVDRWFLHRQQPALRVGASERAAI